MVFEMINIYLQLSKILKSSLIHLMIESLLLNEILKRETPSLLNMINIF